MPVVQPPAARDRDRRYTGDVMTMSVLILSALSVDAARGPAALESLIEAVEARGGGADVVDTPSANIRPCTGCGSCGGRTPGLCVLRDEMQEVFPRLVAADVLVLATPVRFGSHCAQLKKVVDRFQPLMAPLYCVRDGEMNFKPRYPRRPALLGVGLLAPADGEYAGTARMRAAEADAFRHLISRHARNLDPPAYAAAVLTGGDPRGDAVELAVALNDVMGSATVDSVTVGIATSTRARR